MCNAIKDEVEDLDKTSVLCATTNASSPRTSVRAQNNLPQDSNTICFFRPQQWTMEKGSSQPLNEGNTEFSAHVASNDFMILCTEH